MTDAKANKMNESGLITPTKEQHQQIILGKQQHEKVFEGPYFPIPFQKTKQILKMNGVIAKVKYQKDVGYTWKRAKSSQFERITQKLCLRGRKERTDSPNL